MRHVKLWFAGQAANRELADYEVDELDEGFDDTSGTIPRTRTHRWLRKKRSRE
jgi:hypothetical protein